MVNRMLSVVCFSLVLVLSQGCASLGRPGNMRVMSDESPVRLELKLDPGYRDVSNYVSRTITKTYSNGQITRKIAEGLDFSVETKVMKVDPLNKLSTLELTTLKKDGKADLSDFAMPELGEKLNLVLSSTGQVIKAGDFPPGTIYYIPPVSLPADEVKVGDTWPLRADWVSLRNGVPMRMELVSILKTLRDCGSAGPCAEIELSGGVAILDGKSSKISSGSSSENDLRVRFRSEMKGRLIISITNGSVLYSIVRSDETLSGEKESVETSSCMLSYIAEPDSGKIMRGSSVNCDAAGDLPVL